MKKLVLFIVGGLFLGLTVGSYLGGARERDVILEQKAAEKAAAEAQEEAAADHDASVEEAGEDVAGEAHPGESGTSSEEAGASEGEGSDPAIVEPAASEDVQPGDAQDQDQPGDEGEDLAGAPTDPSAPNVQSQASALASAAARAGQEEDLPPEGPVRLAKIFGAMEPRDAAAVLQNLKDGEVEAILMNMSDRKVAEILGEFEPERAASLSRIVLDSRADATQ